MKKFLFILFFILSSVPTYSQYSVIYTAPTNRMILDFKAFSNVHNNDLSVYIYIPSEYQMRLPSYWIRYFRNTQSLDSMPNHGFLKGTYCGGSFGIATSGIHDFQISNTDTSMIVGHYAEGPCWSPEGNDYNLLSFNSGQNFYNPLGNQGVMLYFDIDPVNDSLIYGMGNTYLAPVKFWKTTDKGSSWSYISPPFPFGSYLKVNPVSRNEIFVCALNFLFKSTNYGQSFIKVYQFADQARSVTIDTIDNSLYVVSGDGLHKSTNSGLDFQKIFNLECTEFLIDPEHHNILYLGVWGAGIYKSTNAGNDWRRYFDSPDGNNYIRGIIKYKNDGDTIYAANQRSVYKFWNEVTNVKNISSESPEAFQLYQNYPNPFNPATNLRFEIPAAGYVSLKIYDLLGNEVSVLVNEELKAGSYEYRFDGSNYPSGLYFYKLTSTGKSITKKMLLSK